MTRPVVADTGPLIALARVERLELLPRLYERILVPSAVHAELALDSDLNGRLDPKRTTELGAAVRGVGSPT